MRLTALSLTLMVAVAAPAAADQTPMNRLPADVLNVLAPSARVEGLPGRMAVRQSSCPAVAPADIGRRIVDVAVQEWGFFGFTVVDHTEAEDDEPAAGFPRRGLPPETALRVASSIAGYWAVTPEGGWILGRQNETWNERGDTVRWRYPWSAAFVSWVMCESGIGSTAEFRRAVAHHTYIDQAIRARDGETARGAFVAYDVGEAAIAPGDLLCSGRRPAYRTLAERRRQMGEGARTHCDIVVRLSPEAGHILAIGGNVRGAVSLKVLPASEVGGRLRPVMPSEGPRARPLFAHLKRRGTPPQANSFDSSPTIRAMNCTGPIAVLARTTAPCALSLDD